MALLVVLLVMTFLAVEILPADAARATLGFEASPAELAARRRQLGLDQPVAVRFLHWMRGLATGDLGVSARGRQVWDIVGQPFQNTLVLGALALVLTVLAALALGSLAVLRPGKLLDRGVRSLSTMILTLPEFVVANGLIVVFALGLHLLPSVTVTSSSGKPASPAMLVLPILALAMRQIGWNTRIVRSALAEQLPAPHVDSAIMDGLPRHRILIHYMLPGALPTIAAGVATSVGMVLGGVVAVETIFNFPGIGAVLVEAIRNRDAPLVAAVVALTGLVITVVLMASDLVRAWAVGRKP
ncbi:MAG TPA: ABC transporter permease [Pseudonocardiaceae bacterium]|nr:ABC transporter permease [Pseudonocardiaceae bacterium]